MLGAFEIQRGDERITARAWRTRQARSLVQILLDQQGRVVPADRLVDLIWPDSDPGAGKHSLQVAVRTARTVLEPVLRSGAASRFIVTEGSGYRFSRERCTVDADDLERAHREGMAAERSGDARAAIDAFRTAVALHRGAYLEEHDSEWVLSPRERLREIHLDASQHLADLLVRAGGADEAVAVVERALVADPLRESLYRALMEAHIAAGRRSHALAAYERCARVLRGELGGEPEERTRAVRDRARGGTATASADMPGELRLPFVGRAPELARLADAWARAQREGGIVAIVEGGAGTGKTRLVRELGRTAAARSRALWLAGHESERAAPFAPLRALVASWIERGGATSVRRLGQHAGVLVPLLPAILDVWPDAPRPEAPPDETAQAEAFTRALILMKGEASALVVLDDLHWMDAPTMGWLTYALRREIPGLLVVATRRPAEPGAEPLDALLGDLRRRPGSLTLRLGPLSRAEVEELSSTVGLDPMVAASVAARLYEATGGHALFAVEILRELWERRTTAHPPDLPIPATLRETISSRIARLSAAARSVIGALAVLDVPATASEIAATTESARRDVVSALEELLLADLARTTDDGRRYAIEHPLVARATYEALTPAIREDLHRRAASAAVDAPASIRLRHLELSGADDAAIVAEATAAGIAALDQGQLADAAACLEIADGRGARLPADADARVRVVERLAEALHGIGRWRDAIARCRAALLETVDPLVRSRLLRRIALSLGDVDGRSAEALEALDQAGTEIAGRSDPAAVVERGLLAAARTMAHFYRSEYADVIEHGERALALLRQADDREHEIADALERVGAAHQRLGHLDDAERCHREAGELGRRLGDALLEARARDQLALAIIHRGKLTEARDLLDRALAAYRAAGVPKFEGRALVNLGWANTQLGDLAAARDAYDEAIAQSDPLGARYTVMHALVGVGQVLARLGSFARARADLARGIAMAEAIGTKQRVAHGYLHLAELALLQGDASGARDLVARGTAVGEPIGDAHTIREGQPTLARALIALGEIDGALAAGRRGLARSRESGFVLGEGRARVALAEAEAARGDPAAAMTELEPAIALFRATHAAYDLAVALQVLSTLAPSRAALDAREEAEALARACGARPLLRRLAEVATPAG